MFTNSEFTLNLNHILGKHIFYMFLHYEFELHYEFGIVYKYC